MLAMHFLRSTPKKDSILLQESLDSEAIAAKLLYFIYISGTTNPADMMFWEGDTANDKVE